MDDDDKTHEELMAFLGGFVPDDEPTAYHRNGGQS